MKEQVKTTGSSAGGSNSLGFGFFDLSSSNQDSSSAAMNNNNSSEQQIDISHLILDDHSDENRDGSKGSDEEEKSEQNS